MTQTSGSAGLRAKGAELDERQLLLQRLDHFCNGGGQLFETGVLRVHHQPKAIVKDGEVAFLHAASPLPRAMWAIFEMIRSRQSCCLGLSLGRPAISVTNLRSQSLSTCVQAIAVSIFSPFDRGLL